MSTVATTPDQLTPSATRRVDARAAAGHPAEDRARAELRRRAGLRLRLHPVDGLSVLHELEDLPELHADRRRAPISGSGAGPSTSTRHRAGTPRSPISASSACSISASAWRSACCSRSCSTRRSAARACCGRSTSTRWRCPSSSPASRGNGSSIPASASSRRCTNGAGRASISTGSRTRTSSSTPWSSPASGRPRASSWRCSSPACAASTARS